MSLPTLKLISTSGMLANARNWLLEHARASIYFTVLSTCSISETVRDRTETCERLFNSMSLPTLKLISTSGMLANAKNYF